MLKIREERNGVIFFHVIFEFFSLCFYIMLEGTGEVIVMEYQGHRAALTWKDDFPTSSIHFYPNYPWTTPTFPDERKGHYIDFHQVLALSAIAEYLKQMPQLW